MCYHTKVQNHNVHNIAKSPPLATSIWKLGAHL